MAFHRIPGSSRSVGPYGLMYKGGRTHIGRQVMSLRDFTPSPRSPSRRRRSASTSTSRRSASTSRRSASRRSTRRR